MTNPRATPSGGTPAAEPVPEVEFISLINVRESSELAPRPGSGVDVRYLRKYARSLAHCRATTQLVDA